MTGAERSGLFQRIEQVLRGAVGGDRAVDLQRFLVPQAKHTFRRAALEEGTQLAQPFALDGDAGGHCVAPAFDQQSLVDGLAHETAEVETGNRPSRACSRTG